MEAQPSGKDSSRLCGISMCCATLHHLASLTAQAMPKQRLLKTTIAQVSICKMLLGSDPKHRQFGDLNVSTVSCPFGQLSLGQETHSGSTWLEGDLAAVGTCEALSTAAILRNQPSAPGSYEEMMMRSPAPPSLQTPVRAHLTILES